MAPGQHRLSLVEGLNGKTFVPRPLAFKDFNFIATR